MAVVLVSRLLGWDFRFGRRNVWWVLQVQKNQIRETDDTSGGGLHWSIGSGAG